MTLAGDPKFPVLSSVSLVVDQTRQVLLSVVRGMPARDRVYNELKMRAAVRYPALTIKFNANTICILFSIHSCIPRHCGRGRRGKQYLHFIRALLFKHS